MGLSFGCLQKSMVNLAMVVEQNLCIQGHYISEQLKRLLPSLLIIGFLSDQCWKLSTSLNKIYVCVQSKGKQSVDIHQLRLTWPVIRDDGAFCSKYLESSETSNLSILTEIWIDSSSELGICRSRGWDFDSHCAFWEKSQAVWSLASCTVPG